METRFKIINNENFSYSHVKLSLEAGEGIVLSKGEELISLLPERSEREVLLAFTVDKRYRGDQKLPIRAVLRAGNVILASEDLGLTWEKSGIPSWLLPVLGGVIVFVFLAVLSRRISVVPRVPTKTPSETRIDPLYSTLSDTTRNRYLPVRKIGEGGMGIVYEAKDTVLGRRVALKVMKDEISLRRRERERFLREARIAAQLRHPNIIMIHDVIEDGSGRICLVFEYLDGEDLESIIQREGAIKPDRAVYYVEGILDALSYAHGRGVIHRDMKSSNVMVLRDGGIKVLDFGIARVETDTLYTISGVTSGTPAYMAPEQHEGKEVDARTDIYGVGVIFYEMLTGDLPFRGPDLFIQKQRMGFKKPTELNSSLPSWVDEIVTWCLQPDPSNRPQSAEELMREIKKWGG
ncbi:hypothetical protein DRQ20_05870 [bacterium]|nr:MAG: hypothetical protein DRQ20_05870 [bacterium]